MPTTNYSIIDLDNVTPVSGPTFTNCTDVGSAPLTPNFQGSFNEPAIAEVGILTYFRQTRGEGAWIADLDHDTPTNPVPPDARIRRVRIQMQFAANTNQVTISATYTGGGAGAANTNTTAQVQFIINASPANSAWLTDFNIINDSDSDGGVGTPASVSSSVTESGELIFIEYDFTQNPNGDFPLGYMTFADFITNFNQITFQLMTTSELTVTFTPASNIASGSASGSSFLQAANWTMEVEWYVPIEWTLSPSTITLPDNIIELSRPTPEEPDEEQVEAVWIGDTRIEPDDPWVILWTKLLIRIHIPPNEILDGDVEVDVEIIGTQFSGRVPAGTLTITTADLSGIYQLDDSVFTDTLYDRSGLPTTQEVAIPAPYFVTHLIDNNESDVLHFTGTRIRASGQGSLHQIMQSLDYIQTEQLNDIILRTSNNLVPFSLSNFIDQQANLRVYMDTIEDFMKVDQVIIFFKKIYTGYPQ